MRLDFRRGGTGRGHKEGGAPTGKRGAPEQSRKQRMDENRLLASVLFTHFFYTGGIEELWRSNDTQVFIHFF